MHRIEPMNKERATAVLVDFCVSLDCSEEKFECQGGFLGAFKMILDKHL